MLQNRRRHPVRVLPFTQSSSDYDVTSTAIFRRETLDLTDGLFESQEALLPCLPPPASHTPWPLPQTLSSELQGSIYQVCSGDTSFTLSRGSQDLLLQDPVTGASLPWIMALSLMHKATHSQHPGRKCWPLGHHSAYNTFYKSVVTITFKELEINIPKNISNDGHTDTGDTALPLFSLTSVFSIKQWLTMVRKHYSRGIFQKTVPYCSEQHSELFPFPSILMRTRTILFLRYLCLHRSSASTILGCQIDSFSINRLWVHMVDSEQIHPSQNRVEKAKFVSYTARERDKAVKELSYLHTMGVWLVLYGICLFLLCKCGTETWQFWLAGV